MRLSFRTLQRGNAGHDALRRTIVAIIVPHALV
ncbi:DUF1534 domain-containing protein [Pseudomonas syringae]|nr:DUF1534 domain-containing protein [Pseudomonas syringae]MCF5210488.1 DUF1534 domain-containing protein [Pseudomonas syringae]MCF5215162.1 DUF1534 domain-containing protein [Pseudomonas syringae]MCF5219525.1 DUF1534 domain-containing protein [Pseudomonas syringae]MCF5268488.1 DUF1534 domain-containing protein [Pseudomonas syringae]